MSKELFAATMRASEIVGRESEMAQIEQAIFRERSDPSLQIAFIHGRGGFGKTRLLEETLLWLGHPIMRELYPDFQPLLAEKDWAKLASEKNVLILGLIDFADTQMHSVDQFIKTVHERFVEIGFSFNAYSIKHAKYEDLRVRGASYTLIHQADVDAQEAFIREYKQLIAQYRVVWCLDTAEQLTYITLDWFSEKTLLQPGDLQNQTRQWLVDQIQADVFQNTTFLIAGRPEEGRPFFEGIHVVAQDVLAKVQTVQAKPLTIAATQKYFQALTDDWRRRAGTQREESDKQAGLEISGHFRAIAEKEDRSKVLWLYTAGQPVLLSLFADLIVDGVSIPGPLKAPFAEALKQVGTDSPDHPTLELRWNQWRIEEKFIELLFSQQPNRPTLYRDILRILARIPHGLTAEQIHFALDATDESTVDWLPDARRLREIEQVLAQNLRKLSLVKVQERVQQTSREARLRPNTTTPRVKVYTLQDEVYRIYAEHRAPHIRPRPEIAELWDVKMVALQDHYVLSYQNEFNERQQLYKRLKTWVTERLDKEKEKLTDLRNQEDRVLESLVARLRSSEALDIRIAEPTSVERGQRQEILTLIRTLEQEALYFGLLLDPVQAFNEQYTDIDNRFWAAEDEHSDAMLHAEIWRVLFYSSYTLKFIKFQRPKDLQDPLQILQRAVRQETVAHWIKRFVLRKNYHRAISFTSDVEKVIASWTERSDEEKDYKASWQHTLTRGERLAWEQYAQILSGHPHEAVDILQKMAKRLEALVIRDENEEIPNLETNQPEGGFKGHRSEIRAKRVLCVIYNYLGYGWVNLGEYKAANQAYKNARKWIQDDLGFESRSATILNNQARVLAEMGRHHAWRQCLEALRIRKRLGADLPLALSYATSALILNMLNEPEEAKQQATKALAYAHRVADVRAEGLALIQYGQALRFLARRETRQNYIQGETPEELFETAQKALERALDIFEAPESSEPIRVFEAKIQLGCVHRDRLPSLDREVDLHFWRQEYTLAFRWLEEALAWASYETKPYLILDSLTSVAWTHYHAGELSEALNKAQEAEDLVIEKILKQTKGTKLIAPDKSLPSPDDYEPTVYMHLSRMWRLRARVGIERFVAFARQHKQGNPKKSRTERAREVGQSDESQEYLRSAAEAFTIASIYALLFSVRSSVLTELYNSVDWYTRAFNDIELQNFKTHIDTYHNVYHVDEIKPGNLGILRDFMNETFGI